MQGQLWLCTPSCVWNELHLSSGREVSHVGRYAHQMLAFHSRLELIHIISLGHHSSFARCKRQMKKWRFGDDRRRLALYNQKHWNKCLLMYNRGGYCTHPTSSPPFSCHQSHSFVSVSTLPTHNSSTIMVVPCPCFKIAAAVVYSVGGVLGKTFFYLKKK
jgi:hypothetical protein